MNKTHATIADVAQLAGRSTATVSRHLNGTGNVSLDASRAITRAINELGYVPSASARGLASRQTGMIGLVLQVFPDNRTIPAENNSGEITYDLADNSATTPPVCDHYINEIVRGAESAAWASNSAITISMARGDNLDARIIDMASRVDGMIVVNNPLPRNLLDHVARRVPVVIVAGMEHPDVLDYVYSTNESAIATLLEHITTDHQAQEFYFVAGTKDSVDDQQRFSAFQQGLRDAGKDVPLEPQYRANYRIEDARHIAHEIASTLDWSASAPLRAFVCSNDETALGMLEVFAQKGIQVPEQALVTGFDDYHVAQYPSPRLTSVRQSTHDLATLAVSALIARIGQPAGDRTVAFVPATVIIRETCGVHDLQPRTKS